MTIIEFRKVSLAPLAGCAENGGRGDIKLAAPLTSHFPQNPHTDGFHASESFSESFVCTDALDSAHGVYAWVAICLAVECALGLFGWWVA